MSQDAYQSTFGASAIAVRHDMAIEIMQGTAPLTCRWPEGTSPRGLAVFCHGLGTSGRDYGRLSEAWAARGYLVLHPTFPDWIGAVAAAEPALGLDPASDLSGWPAIPHVRARMHEILHAPQSWMARVRIVRAVMDALPEILAATCGTPVRPLPAAIAGHSFGAYTAQLFTGAVIDLPGQPGWSCRDARFGAALLLSAQGRDQQGLRDGSWDAMTGPMMCVTGTLDRGAKGQDWRWKSEPFHLAPPGDKYLSVLVGGDHYLGGLKASSPEVVPSGDFTTVAELTLAFLDATLADSSKARAWLTSGSKWFSDNQVLMAQRTDC